MAQCLEFDQIITRVGKFATSIPSSSSDPYRARLSLYTVPAGHVAKIDRAENLGSGLMYGVKSAGGTFSGSIALTGADAGESLPTRHRNLSGSWLSAGDQLYAYDTYDMDSTAATSHPDGFYAVIIEYNITTC